MKLWLSMLAAVVLLESSACGALLISNEDQLVSNLMSNFLPVGRIARPEPASGGNVSVDMSLFLIRFWPGRKGDSMAEIDVWISLMWRDPRLSWDPMKFGNISQVALPHDSVWLPDIRPFNAKGYQPDKETASRVVVFYNSQLIYVLPASMKVPCSVAANHSTACNIELGSWVYNGYQVDLVPIRSNPFDMTDFMNADKWTVAKAEAKRTVKKYSCCEEPYVSIKYSLELNPKKMSKKGKKKNKKRPAPDED